MLACPSTRSTGGPVDKDTSVSLVHVEGHCKHRQGEVRSSGRFPKQLQGDSLVALRAVEKNSGHRRAPSGVFLYFQAEVKSLIQSSPAHRSKAKRLPLASPREQSGRAVRGPDTIDDWHDRDGAPLPRINSACLLGQLKQHEVPKRLGPKALSFHYLVELAESVQSFQGVARPDQGEHLMVGPSICTKGTFAGLFQQCTH
eukprot:6491761-Amphidinium_carterae.1